MKKNRFTFFTLLILQMVCVTVFAQAEKNELLLDVAYYNNNNQTQYLVVTAKSKIDGKFQMIPNISLSFYITDETPANLLGKAVTNDKGKATLMIPASAKEAWNSAARQTFHAVSVVTRQFDETRGSTEITKAKIQIDTAADKTIAATLLALKDSIWVPVAAADLRVAIKRLGGDLNVNETPAYTTDSLGMVTAEFKRENLPGDAKGNLTLIARLDESELYGNLSAETVVPWGVVETHVSTFDHRTLFARRGHSPWWLEAMAYSIVVAVWGILIYLVFQIRKIKQMGAE